MAPRDTPKLIHEKNQNLKILSQTPFKIENSHKSISLGDSNGSRSKYLINAIWGKNRRGFLRTTNHVAFGSEVRVNSRVHSWQWKTTKIIVFKLSFVVFFVSCSTQETIHWKNWNMATENDFKRIEVRPAQCQRFDRTSCQNWKEASKCIRDWDQKQCQTE